MLPKMYKHSTKIVSFLTKYYSHAIKPLYTFIKKNLIFIPQYRLKSAFKTLIILLCNA